MLSSAPLRPNCSIPLHWLLAPRQWKTESVITPIQEFRVRSRLLEADASYQRMLDEPSSSGVLAAA